MDESTDRATEQAVKKHRTQQFKKLIFNKLTRYTLLFIKVHTETSPSHWPAIATIIRHGGRIFTGRTATIVLVVLTHFMLHRVYAEVLAFISTYTTELMSFLFASEVTVCLSMFRAW